MNGWRGEIEWVWKWRRKLSGTQWGMKLHMPVNFPQAHPANKTRLLACWYLHALRVQRVMGTQQRDNVWSINLHTNEQFEVLCFHATINDNNKMALTDAITCFTVNKTIWKAIKSPARKTCKQRSSSWNHQPSMKEWKSPGIKLFFRVTAVSKDYQCQNAPIWDTMFALRRVQVQINMNFNIDSKHAGDTSSQ